MTATPLPYLTVDADQHSMPPHDAYERYIDPKQRDKAVRNVRGLDGKWETLYAGRSMRMPPKRFQVTFGDDPHAPAAVRAAQDVDPQIVFANLAAASAMLSAFYLHVCRELDYAEVCFDIRDALMRPLELPAPPPH